MHTAIGECLKSSPGRLAAASALAVLVVAADVALVRKDYAPLSMRARDVLALCALAATVWLFKGDLTSTGFRLMPVQGWWYWGRAVLLIGLAVAACIVVGQDVWSWSGHELQIRSTTPENMGVAFVWACVFAPLVEETVYRLVLCTPLAVLLGPWPTIAVSGLVFGGLHVVYGNPSPENLVGGFFLAWAYLKSESLVVPVLLHSLGNLCGLAAQIGAWYWLRGVV